MAVKGKQAHSVTDSLNGGRDSDNEESVLCPEYRAVYAGHKFKVMSLFPPLTWVPAYVHHFRGRSTEAEKAAMGLVPFSLQGDVIAGITIGIMLVPQSLAFALLAGLPVKVGLYSAFLPLIAYALFGSIRQLQVGPTALMSLITGGALDACGYLGEERVAFAALIALGVGILSCFLGLIRFGFIVDFMSHSVMAAFVCASGVIMTTSQLNIMLGIKIPRSEYWWENVRYLAENIHSTNWPTPIMGFSLLFFLLFSKGWKSAGTKEQRSAHRLWRLFPKDKTTYVFRACKLLADLSSVVSVIIGWLWGFCYRSVGVKSVTLVGKSSVSGFVFAVPGSGLQEIAWSHLIDAAVTITIVGFVETVAVGGKLAAQARYSYDSSQELLALGVSNLASSVMSGYPGTGSFNRTATNAVFGATSQIAGILSAWIVFLAVYLIMPAVELLPQVALAPLTVQGALAVTNFEGFRSSFHTSKFEFFLMVCTFGVSLGLTVKEGLITGVGLSVLKVVYDTAMPNMVLCGEVKDGSFRDIRNYPEAHMPGNCVVVRIDAALSFANARRFEEFCLRCTEAQSQILSKYDPPRHLKCLIMDVKSVNGIDITGIEMVENLAETLHQRGQSLIVANLKARAVAMLLGAHVDVHLRKRGGCLCWNMPTALAVAAAMDCSNHQGHETGIDGSLIEEAQKEVDDFFGRVKLATKPLADVPASRVLRLLRTGVAINKEDIKTPNESRKDDVKAASTADCHEGIISCL